MAASDSVSDEPQRKTHEPYERLMRKIAIAVLAIGLCAAAAILVLAPPDVEDQPGPYVASVDNSKRYQLELERIGGRSAVVAAQFNEWFESLWHGRRLAGTVAALSAVFSLLVFLAAKLPPLDD
jgi:hypothetical protein